MAFSLMDHENVPFHEIVSAEETGAVLAKYGVNRDQMPVLMADDPIAQELQAKRGDLIRIYRKSPTAGISVYYRVVL